jgi:hypothetical protein
MHQQFSKCCIHICIHFFFQLDILDSGNGTAEKKIWMKFYNCDILKVIFVLLCWFVSSSLQIFCLLFICEARKSSSYVSRALTLYNSMCKLEKIALPFHYTCWKLVWMDEMGNSTHFHIVCDFISWCRWICMILGLLKGRWHQCMLDVYLDWFYKNWIVWEYFWLMNGLWVYSSCMWMSWGRVYSEVLPLWGSKLKNLTLIGMEFNVES